MARQFFDAQNPTTLRSSFSPAQIGPIQDLVPRQLSLIATRPAATPNLNDVWAVTQRAPSLPQKSLSPAAWASEFGSGTFSSGLVVQQNVTPANGTFAH